MTSIDKQHKNSGFQPGVSGNPKGRPKKSETYSDTLRAILEAKSINIKYTYTDKNGDTQIEHVAVTSDNNMYYGVAAALIREALAGSVAAQREIADRVQGKPPQALDVTTQGDKVTSTPLTKEQEIAISRALKDAENNK